MGTDTTASAGASKTNFPPKDVTRLARFFIFNSSFGPREGDEGQRIIFFYSDIDEEMEKEELRTKQVGLAEAVVRFSSMFSDRPCQSLHTQKTKSVFLEPESGYFLVLTAAIPCYARRKASTDGVTAGTTEYVYQPENVHDNVLVSMLQRSYEMFKFFTGGFDNLHGPDSAFDREVFCDRVTAFFSRYLASGGSGGMQHLDRQDVSDLFPAVHFLTLESSAFLQVQSFVNRTEDEFPCIETCVFFHQGFVAWSGLQQHETSLLYHYIYTSLFPSMHARLGSSSTHLGPFSGHQGRFLTGPSNLKDIESSLSVPRICIPHFTGSSNPNDTNSNLHEYHLLVYHALSATLCLIIPVEIELSLDLFRQLDVHLGPRLTHMSADLHNVFGRNLTGSADPNSSMLSTSPSISSLAAMSGGGDSDMNNRTPFLYYNSFNHAMKSTLPQAMMSKSVASAASLTEEAMLKEAAHVIIDFEQDFGRIQKRSGVCDKASSVSEISAKLQSEQWVIGKRDGHREVYSFIPTKNSNLIDVTDEVDRLMATEFKNICLLEK